MVHTKEAVTEAKRLYRMYETRNPYLIAKYLEITIIECDFTTQKGAYRYFQRNGYIFVNKHLDSVMKAIVIFHEIGHHVLHRNEAVAAGYLKEFNLFDMKNSEMELEANSFTAEFMLDEDKVLEYIGYDYNLAQIARAMYSDINLVALKVAELNSKGYHFREQEYRNRFLK